MRFLGISRGERFSPNMSAKDRAIMEAVAVNLRELGHLVTIVSEDDDHGLALLVDAHYDAVFAMLRGAHAIKVLSGFEAKGISAVNSAKGIVNAERKNMMRIMDAQRFPMPKTIIVECQHIAKDEALPQKFIPDVPIPCWIKNGEGWAQCAEDVSFADTREQVLSAISGLCRRYPSGTVILSEHLQGDLVKFYGVEHTDFFFWKYPDPANSKFGLEAINGTPSRYNFDVDALKQTCDKLALATGISIYGGDCVIADDGSFRIIDFNDWPSFSSCRQQAAQAITQRILTACVL